MKSAGIFRRIRLKYLGRIEMGQSPPSSAYSISAEDGLPFLQGTADFGALSPTPQVYCGTPTKLARAGDILFSVRAPVGEINLADQDYGIGRGLCAISPRAGWNPQFAWWSLHEARYQLSYVATGSTYEAVTVEDVGNLLLEYGPEHIQHAVVDYLDRETAWIDTLIAEKARLLGLLAEKRRTLIKRAVTRGLNPNVPFSDSSIQWLGQIPAHWETVPLKRVASLKSGEFIASKLIDAEGDFPVFGANGIRGYCSSYTHKGEHVLIGRQGALCGNISYAAGRFWASEHAVVVTTGEKCKVRWLRELLDAMDLNQYSQSAAQPGLSVEFIEGLKIPVPPMPEQSAIVEFITDATTRIDKLIDIADRTTALLEERRSALVVAAVTGMIDVGSPT